MALQFPSSDFPNEDGEAFLESMRALETKVKTDAMTFSKEWFGKNITSPDVMDEKFNVMLRHPKIKGTQEPDLSKAPTLTVKIPCWSGVWKTEIYDEDGEPLYINGKVNTHLTPLEFLKPKTHVKCLLQCGGLWFVNGKVSITWNLKQVMAQKPKDSMEGTCFLMLKASDKAKMKTLPPPEDVDPDGPVTSLGVTLVDDSDEEMEVPTPVSSQLPVPTPVLVPVASTLNTDEAVEVKPKKKIIRKKTDS
jgi:hypothetical protein